MVNLEIKDLSPKFLEFYEESIGRNLDPEARFQLWQRVYGFAALPPTPDGDLVARTMLDECWDKYPAVLERIRGCRPSPDNTLNRIIELFECKRDMHIKIVWYVGALEANAFTYAESEAGPLVVCMPVEHPDSWMTLCMAHEFAHIVHMGASGLRMQWERPTAVTILMEGLAMHTSAALNPNRSVEEYTEHRPGWLEACNKVADRIYEGITPYLCDSTSETVFRFTMGNGTTGMDREAYYVGWNLVQYLRDQGWPFSRIAHLSESEIIGQVTETLAEMQLEGIITNHDTPQQTRSANNI